MRKRFSFDIAGSSNTAAKKKSRSERKHRLLGCCTKHISTIRGEGRRKREEASERASAAGCATCVFRISSSVRWIPEWVRKGTRRNAIFPGRTLKTSVVWPMNLLSSSPLKVQRPSVIDTSQPRSQSASLRRPVTPVVSFLAPWENESSEFAESLISMEPSHQSQPRCRAIYATSRIIR